MRLDDLESVLIDVKKENVFLERYVRPDRKVDAEASALCILLDSASWIRIFPNSSGDGFRAETEIPKLFSMDEFGEILLGSVTHKPSNCSLIEFERETIPDGETLRLGFSDGSWIIASNIGDEVVIRLGERP